MTDTLPCEYCFPGATLVGRVGDHLAVVIQDGQHVLIDEQVHDTALVRFTVVPVPDPFTDEVEAALEALPTDTITGAELAEMAEIDGWVALAREQMAPLDDHFGGNMRFAWNMVNSLIAAGYDPAEHGDAELWLYDAIGKVITGT